MGDVKRSDKRRAKRDRCGRAVKRWIRVANIAVGQGKKEQLSLSRFLYRPERNSEVAVGNFSLGGEGKAGRCWRPGEVWWLMENVEEGSKTREDFKGRELGKQQAAAGDRRNFARQHFAEPSTGASPLSEWRGPGSHTTLNYFRIDSMFQPQRAPLVSYIRMGTGTNRSATRLFVRSHLCVATCRQLQPLDQIKDGVVASSLKSRFRQPWKTIRHQAIITHFE